MKTKHKKFLPHDANCVKIKPEQLDPEQFQKLLQTAEKRTRKIRMQVIPNRWNVEEMLIAAYVQGMTDMAISAA